MGARAAILLTVAASACVAATAAAAPTAAPIQATCNAKAITVLFWPKGHKVVRSLGFPASPRPHMEIFRYAAARTYTPANQIGLAEANGPASFHPKCAKQTPTVGLTKLPARKTSAAAAVSCSFASTGTMQMQKVGTSYDVKLLDGKKIVLQAKVAPTGSSLSASTQQCRIGAAPK